MEIAADGCDKLKKWRKSFKPWIHTFKPQGGTLLTLNVNKKRKLLAKVT